jgi:hypothetical protein
MSAGVAETAVTSLAVALGSRDLDKDGEIGGMHRADLDGRCEVIEAVRTQGTDGQSPKTLRTRASWVGDSITVSSDPDRRLHSEVMRRR